MRPIVCAVLFLFASVAVASVASADPCPCTGKGECKCVTAPGGKGTCGSFLCRANSGARQLTYAEVFDRVTKGERLTLSVGLPRCPTCAGWVESLPGIPAGAYECWRENGQNRMKPLTGCPLKPRAAGELDFSAQPVGSPVIIASP